jgi:hypothetical protein
LPVLRAPLWANCAIIRVLCAGALSGGVDVLDRREQMKSKKVYKVIFYNINDDIYEIYASHVFPSDMYGFIEVEELLFGEKSQLLVDPGEERLKSEFEGVKRTFIPMNAVVRIDEVQQQGAARVTLPKSTVTSFPGGKGPQAGS